MLVMVAAGLAIAQVVRLEGPPRTSEANLLAHWRFDEGTGTTVTDCSGNGNTGTFDGSWSRGRFGSAGKFAAASTQEVTVASSATLNMGTGNFSVALWVRTSTVAAAMLVSKYSTVGFFVGIDAAGRVNCKVRDASTNVSVLSTGSITDGKWHLVVMTVDRSDAATGLKIHVDGLFNTQGQQGAGSIDNAEALYIGQLLSSYYLTGEVDEVTIWKRIITAEEILRLWAQTTIKAYIGSESSGKPLAF